MFIETTIPEAEVSLAAPSASINRLAVSPRVGWILGKLVVAALLITYLVGWVQDFQRVQRLEAEPTPPFKIITKYEAWQQIHPRPARLLRPPTLQPGHGAAPGRLTLLGGADAGSPLP